jgi:hypothetical protein
MNTVLRNIWACLTFEKFIPSIYILLYNIVLLFQRIVQNVYFARDKHICISAQSMSDFLLSLGLYMNNICCTNNVNNNNNNNNNNRIQFNSYLLTYRVNSQMYN